MGSANSLWPGQSELSYAFHALNSLPWRARRLLSTVSIMLRSRVSGSHWGIIRKYGLNINRQSFRELAKDIGFVKVRRNCDCV